MVLKYIQTESCPMTIQNLSQLNCNFASTSNVVTCWLQMAIPCTETQPGTD